MARCRHPLTLRVSSAKKGSADALPEACLHRGDVGIPSLHARPALCACRAVTVSARQKDAASRRCGRGRRRHHLPRSSRSSRRGSRPGSPQPDHPGAHQDGRDDHVPGKRHQPVDGVEPPQPRQRFARAGRRTVAPRPALVPEEVVKNGGLNRGRGRERDGDAQAPASAPRAPSAAPLRRRHRRR